MFDLIGGIRGIFATLLGAALMFVALGAYDRLIDDPQIAAAARAGYVALAEKTALEAKLLAETRRRAAVEAASADFARRKLIAEAIAAQKTEQLEQEVAAYEAKLLAANRLCRLDGADIEFLRQSSNPIEGIGKNKGER